MKFYTSVAVHRNDILLRGYEDGEPIRESVPYKPYLFWSSTDETAEYRTIFNSPVERVDFDSIREARDFISTYQNVDGISLYGMNRFIYPFIFDRYPGRINFDASRIRVAIIDIEVASDKGFPDIEAANHEITAITIKLGNLTYAFGCGEFTTDNPDITYYQCDSEIVLLHRFIELWRQLDPDVVTGWNIETFDIPYIINRITNVIGEVEAKRLSPWKILRDRTIEIRGKEHTVYNPVGVAVMDYLALYKKFTFTQQESYSLDNIANVELGEKKLDYSQYGSLINLYRENFQLFMEYNIRDVELVSRIDTKRNFLGLAYSLSYEAKINFEDALTSVTMWDVIIHNYLLEQKMVVPFQGKNEWREFEGAFVKDPQCAMHRWVVSFDLTSMYPMLIQQFNISPETYVGQIPEPMSIDRIFNGGMEIHKDDLIANDLAVAANLCLYSKKEKGFMPKLMAHFFDLRKEAKDEQLRLEGEQEATKKDLKTQIGIMESHQMVIKVVLNSLYGVLGNKYFRWFQVEHAEAITSSGQLVIKWAARQMNVYLNKVLGTDDKDYIIAMDTDSLYITLNDLVQRVMPEADANKIVSFLDKACGTKLTDALNKGFEELAVYMNAYENKMTMKREIIAENGLWTGKKRYALRVWFKETTRYDKPKTKISGIESVRSTTPAICKPAIKEAIDIILSGTEDQLIEHVKNFRKKYMSSPLGDIGIPTGVNGIEKYKSRAMVYEKGTPQHIKGALIYNNMRSRKNITNYPPIYDGDKVKLFLMIKPNPTHEGVISVPNYLPEELKLDQYVDKDAMFDRSFLSPVMTLLDVIGWKSKKENTLF